MAAPARPSLDIAEPAVIRHRARQMRLAARQTLDRARQTHAQARMRSAVRVRSSPPAQGSLLAQLLQPLLTSVTAPADASSAVTEPELAAMPPSSTPAIRAELEGSLATIRSQVQAIHRQFQHARQDTVVTRTGHLRLVPPPASAPTSRTPHPPRRALRGEQPSDPVRHGPTQPAPGPPPVGGWNRPPRPGYPAPVTCRPA